MASPWIDGSVSLRTGMVNWPGDPSVRISHALAQHVIGRGERILFKTHNSDHCWDTDSFIEDFVYLSAAAAQYLAERQVRLVGSVNANKRHWYKAGEALARADRKWLEQLITRREKPENFEQALERRSDDIKVVIQFSEI